MIIVDVGSGDGKRCVKWLETWKECLIYAFEPDPRQFKKLEATRMGLKVELRNRFKIFNAAVWDSNGEVDFYMCNDDTSSSVLPFVDENIKKWKYPPGRYFFKTEKKIKVQSMRLDSMCKREHIEVIDFLRIDAQGCTEKILQSVGKKGRHIKEIFLKVHVSPVTIYKNQATRFNIEEILKKKYYFEDVHITPYSRGQEAWIRYHSDVWKRVRNSRIYELE